MRSFLTSVCFWNLLLFLVAGLGQLIATNRILTNQNSLFQQWATQLQQGDHRLSFDRDLEQRARQRAALYIDRIEEGFLEDGMVVGRNILGEPEDLCDSLLFTSLYYVSLNKLGYKDKALKTWRAIEKSRQDGQWFRHPRCRKTTSRDMILGVLAALSQDPPGTRNHILETLGYVEKTNGYLSRGRADIGYLAPGVGEIFRIFAAGQKILPYTLPAHVSWSFSTLEFSALISQTGYRSHLIALGAWLEMELNRHERYSTATRIRTATSNLSPLTNPFSPTRLDTNRLPWVTNKIFNGDPKNLFFRFLRLQSADALTPLSRSILLYELLSMDQFPARRLPDNCDRKADYLWQRDSDEYNPRSGQCVSYFSGVDFLWMAALLLDGDPLKPDFATNSARDQASGS